MEEVIFDFDTVIRKPKIVSSYLSQIRDYFSIEDKALLFLKRRTGRQMPVRKYAITSKGHFDSLFYETICEEIRQKFPGIKLKASQKFLEQTGDYFITDKPLDLKLTPRDYQLESATEALKKGQGIIVLPTSAGKTFTMALIANTIVRQKDYNVLVLVPNIQLVQQTFQDFLDYGIPEDMISKWTGNHPFCQTKIVVANSQILLSKTQDTTVLNNFEVLIGDECHRFFSAVEITKLIKSQNFIHKFGLTGTLPEIKFDVWSLNRIFGPVIYFKKSVELREEKFISKVRIVALEMSYKNIPKFTKPSMSNPTTGYEEEIVWLHTNEHRSKTIAKLVEKLETNTLVLVDRIIHGEHLLDYLKLHTQKQVYFVQGSVEVEERERVKQLMEDTVGGIVCIAISKIFSTGISIKNLHNIIFAAIGKARIKIIQSIGRSLRLHHSKEIATIFDIADVNLYYGLKHFEERSRLYESEKIPIITKEVYED